MTQTLPQFITSTILVGGAVTLLLVWSVFHRGLLLLEKTKEKLTAKTLVTGAILLAWFFLALFLAQRGFFEARGTDPREFPNIVFTFLPLLAGTILLAFSQSFKRLIDALPLPLLMGIQLYRALGFLFITAYTMHLLPAEFAIPAGVGDVLVGVTAPLVAYAYATGKKYAKPMAVAWNILGIADLALAMTLGFLTSPGPLQLLAHEAPNTLVSAYPLVMVPAFAVPLSILLHIFALRRILKPISIRP